MQIQTILAAILSAVLLLVAPQAVAIEESDNAPYLGAGAVYAQLTNLCGQSQRAATSPRTRRLSCKDAEVGLKIFGGFHPSENFRIETGVIMAEGYESTFLLEEREHRTVAELRLKHRSFYLAGVGVFPISDSFAMTGKIGIRAWRDTVSGERIDSNSNYFVLEGGSEHGEDPLFGVGAEFKPSDRLSFQAEWMRLPYDGRAIDLDVFSGGFSWHF